jgi:tricorn protease
MRATAITKTFVIVTLLLSLAVALTAKPMTLNYEELSDYAPDFARQPVLSPDGKTVCFSYMTDLWTVPFAGGEAKRITVSEGDDARPIYSPDGKWIAFSSDREGFRGIYVIPADGGRAQLVNRETYVSISDWYKDSNRLLGTKYSLTTGTGLYEIDLQGNRMKEVTAIGHQFSKLSPDNKKIIFNRGGYAYRPAYTGSASGDLWEYDVESGSYTQLTFTNHTERYPVYSYVSPYIYFAGSDGERFQLYRVENYNFAQPEQLTFFDDWSVRNISIARESDRIVFERFNKLWKYNPETGKTEEISISIKQDFIPNFAVSETYNNRADNMAISPDGKLIAFSYKYDLFAMPEKGGEVKRLTFDNSGIDQILIGSDNQTIYFLKRDRGFPILYSVKITAPDNIVKNEWSSDKYIQYMYKISDDQIALHYEQDEARSKVAFFNTRTGEIKRTIEENPVWSRFLGATPDMNYLFYVTGVPQVWTRHLYIYDVNAKKSTQIASNINYIGNLNLGLDLKSLFVTWNGSLARIDLVPKGDFYRETDNWDDIFTPDSKNDITDEDSGFNIQFEGIRSRIHPISNLSGTNYVVHIDSDSTLYYINRNQNTYTFRKIDYMGKNDEELYSLKGNVSNTVNGIVFNEANKQYYAVVDNAITKINPKGKSRETVENTIEYSFNELDLNKKVFDELWAEFGSNFYDYNMHKRDWSQMYNRYRPYIEKSYNMDYFSNVVSEMIGELNASHTGFTARTETRRQAPPFAGIGADLDFGKVPERGIYLKTVYCDSVLNQLHGVKDGDLLLSVDGEEIRPDTPIAPLFENKVDKKIILEIVSGDHSSRIRPDRVKKIELKGISFAEENDLQYHHWVETRRQKVEQMTAGRLGYLHIRRMNRPSYDKFLNDLFALNYDKEGLIIDIRNNGGGNISSDLLDVLSRDVRAYTTSRGYPDERFITPRHVFDKPMVVLINERSFSDAEIFPILFRQKGLGKVIGMPTGGGVIGTTPYSLMDGSSMRLPRTGWFTIEGVNMEGTGAQPDIEVDMTPEQLIEDYDIQLRTAIDTLFEMKSN